MVAMADIADYGENSRLGDEVYLGEPPAPPKEYYKAVVGIIESFCLDPAFSLLDVGCATGSFLATINGRWPRARMTGMDIHSDLLERAAASVAGADFITGSVLAADPALRDRFDVVTMMGVVSIFDDPTPAIANALSYTKPGGRVVIFTQTNDLPVDVLVRFALVEESERDKSWRTGLNVHSIATFERIREAVDPRAKSLWVDFVMPFPLDYKAPLRAWTTRVGDDPHAHINGLRMVPLMKIWVIERPS